MVDRCPEQDAALNGQQPFTAAIDTQGVAYLAAGPVGGDDVLGPQPVAGTVTWLQRDTHPVVVLGKAGHLGAGPQVGSQCGGPVAQDGFESVLGDGGGPGG